MTTDLTMGKQLSHLIASQRLLYNVSMLTPNSDTNEIMNTITRVRQLHKEGADLDFVAQDDDMTVLGHAVLRRMEPIVNVLAHLGCNMDMPIKNKHPLLYAGMIDPGFMKVLVDNGSGVNLDSNKKTTLIEDVRLNVGEESADQLHLALLGYEEEQNPQHAMEHVLFDFTRAREEEMKERNEKRKHYLKLLTASTPFRSYSATPSSEALDSLYERFPNFHEVLDHVNRQICLARLSEKSVFTMAPILLHGAPGIGKTRFIRELSIVLGIEFNKISCGSLTAGWVISGSSTSWEEGRPGHVLTSLRDGKTANPIIMLDEIDKMRQDGKYTPFGALYDLLEDSTAASFVDESIALPIDASKVSWVATANEVDSVPQAILSRMHLIEVETPTPEQMVATIASIMTDIIKENEYSWGSRFSPNLADDVVGMLIDYSPRDIRNMIKDAMGEAAASRDEAIYDLKESDFVTLRKRRRGPGFV
ncbi:AAA family ATPase [Methylobacillus sp. Pita2]|uniref:AAA family ATPase n=1 Tax=Methylobacillus sp. Pita2 TaxID=3383245 RepID=UPI0038B519C1